MRHPLRKIATQGAWYAASNTLAKLGGLILLPLYTNTRYLDVADFGRWGVFEITIPLAVAAFGLTLPVGLIRYYPDPQVGHKAAATTWWLTVAIALAVAGPAFLLSGLLAPDGQSSIYCLLIAFVAFELLLGVPLALFRAREQAGRYATVLALKLALIVALNGLFLVRQGRGLEGLVIAYTLGSALSLGIALLLAAEPWILIPKVDRATASMLLRFSVPLIVGGLSSVLLNAGDRYVLALFRSPEEVGYYTLAAKFGGLVNMLLAQPLVLAWLPILVRLHEDQRQEVLRQLFRHFGLALGLAASGICVLTPAVLLIMGSAPEYRNAIPLVPWIAFGFAAFGLSVLFYGVLALFQKTAIASGWILAAAALNLAMNFMLVPHFGAFGSALSTLVSYAFLLAGQARSSARWLPCRCPWRQLLGVWILSAVVAWLGVSIPASLSFVSWLERAALLGGWCLVVSLTRWFTWGELREVLKILRARG